MVELLNVMFLVMFVFLELFFLLLLAGFTFFLFRRCREYVDQWIDQYRQREKRKQQEEYADLYKEYEIFQALMDKGFSGDEDPTLH